MKWMKSHKNHRHGDGGGVCSACHRFKGFIAGLPVRCLLSGAFPVQRKTPDLHRQGRVQVLMCQT